MTTEEEKFRENMIVVSKGFSQEQWDALHQMLKQANRWGQERARRHGDV